MVWGMVRIASGKGGVSMTMRIPRKDSRELKLTGEVTKAGMASQAACYKGRY
jgi:hypothetical protein